MQTRIPLFLALASAPSAAFAQPRRAAPAHSPALASSGPPPAASSPAPVAPAASVAPVAAVPAEEPSATDRSAAVAATTAPSVAPSPELPPPPPPSAPTVPPSASSATPPLASWHNDMFYIASPDHRWFVIPTGRVQIDGLANIGDGASSDYLVNGAFRRPDTTNGFSLRRARLELAGGFLDRFTFLLAGDFANTAAPIATDVFVGARIHRLFNLTAGQFNAPFTMENRSSDKYLDFLERSLVVRALAIPGNKEIGVMAWGETTNRMFYYSMGAFNGDGPNRINRDSYIDGIGRALVRPFAGSPGSLLENAHFGGSFRLGWRGRSTDYAYPNMSTQGGWTFFSSALTAGANPVSLAPDALQAGFAAELYVPINRFDIRGEFVYVNNGTAEIGAPGSASLASASSLALGSLSGIGGYAQVGYWLLGNVGINGRPGVDNPPSLRLDRPDPTPPFGIQAVARFDSISFDYNASSRGGTANARADGNYTVNALEFGLNVWWTKHVRLGLNYMHYLFPNQAPMGMAAGSMYNHARGPNNNAGGFGELMLRLGLAI